MKLEILDEPGNDGEVTITIPAVVSSQFATSMSYSKDGVNWTDTAVDNTKQTITIPVSAGDTVYLKGVAHNWAFTDWYNNSPFTKSTNILATCDHNVSGNIMSLIYGDNFENQSVLPAQTTGNYESTFGGLFINTKQSPYKNTHLKSAANLLLPATTLSDHCYYYMFSLCTSLTAAPALPATIMYNRCYAYMFDHCSSLINAPALPATTLAYNCYERMFQNCTSLTAAPALPATMTIHNCYKGMFSSCTSLVNAPALPATRGQNTAGLSIGCYSSMFYGCTSLVNAPALPATDLGNSCYQYMFSSCTSLVNAPALPATALATQCYEGMFQGCTSLISAESKGLSFVSGSTNQLTNWLNGINTTGTLTVPANTQIADADWYKPANWTLVKDYSGMPLTLKVMSASEIESATGDNSFTDGDPADIMINIPSYVDDSLATSLSYSTDGGTTWTTEAVDNTDQQITISTEIGGTVLLKGIANQWATSTDIGLNITGSHLIAEGNVMSLIYGDNFAGQTSFPANTDSNLSSLFQGCELYDASNLVLPATTLTDWCYYYMFDNCQAMVNGPAVLPATTLAPGCYREMFQACGSLERAPEIMATATAGDPEQLDHALTLMFSSCETLNEVRCHIEDGTIDSSWLDGCALDTAEVDPETGEAGPVTDFTLYVPTDTQIADADWYVPTGGIISKTL